jgi:hypothetical protein
MGTLLPPVLVVVVDQVCVYFFVRLRREWNSVDVDDIATLVWLTRGSGTRLVIGFGGYDDSFQLLGIQIVELMITTRI